jgi:hypothetical protein
MGRHAGPTDGHVPLPDHRLSKFAALVLIRLLCGHLLVTILATLLALTTPVGTGQGVHQHELLHPVWAHVHLVDGKPISDDQRATPGTAGWRDRTVRYPPRGSALGAGNGADAFDPGIGVGPMLPSLALTLPGTAEARLSPVESRCPTEYRKHRRIHLPIASPDRRRVAEHQPHPHDDQFHQVKGILLCS